jgi:subtilisin family serine protease
MRGVVAVLLSVVLLAASGSATVAAQAPTVHAASADAASTAMRTPYRAIMLNPARATTVMLQLASPAVAVREAGSTAMGIHLADAGRAAIRASLRERQDALRPRIVALGGQVLGQYQDAYDGIKVRIAQGEVAALRALPGVIAVVGVPVYARSNVTSDTFTGVAAAWATGTGYTGRGVKIAVIDSGIDYYHADFGGSGSADDYAADDGLTARTGVFPNAKVAGGFDLVGDSYNASGFGGAIFPHPDADPLDCGEGHGTHVAGTAAGYGVTSNGKTYRGPYDAKALATQHFLIGPGAAPEAQLYAVKVFGCGEASTTDAVIDGIDWAVKTHVDVINMSLGSPFGSADSPDVAAVENAVRAGIVVVASAGNEGPVAYTTGAPAVASGAISVAAVDAHQSFPGATIGVGDGIQAIDANNADLPVTGRLDVLPGSQGEIGLGCDPGDYSDVQAGDIVVTRRGVCPRVDRATLGEAAGAAAVVMVNDADTPGLPPFEDEIPDVTIPFIGAQHGASSVLIAHDGETLTIVPAGQVTNPAFRAAADFSSGGPRGGDGLMKPDVAAPGVAVRSAAVGSGSKGITFSGTSMSSPFVAGVAALVRQAHPGWSPLQVKAAIQNTASATAIRAYDPRVDGAGLVQPARAVTSVALATAGTDVASLSFGQPELSGAFSGSGTIRIQNTGDATLTYGLASRFTGPRFGARMTISPATVTVNPGQTASVRVTLSLDAAAVAALPPADSPGGHASLITAIRGAVTATPATAASGVFALRVPFLLAPRSVSDITTPATVRLAQTMTPNIDLATADIQNQGFRQGSADIYAWGIRSGALGLGAIDIRAAGVAVYDHPVGGAKLDPGDRLIVFATNVFGRWTTAAANEYDVGIDTDGSGTIDFVVFEADHGAVTNGEPDGKPGCFLQYGSDFTIVDASLTVAPVNSSTLLCGVTASLLEITSLSQPFDYAVAAGEPIGNGAIVNNVAGVGHFDAFAPSISQGQHAVLRAGAVNELELSIDSNLFPYSPALGWMVVSLDDAAGPLQADTIPAILPGG